MLKALSKVFIILVMLCTFVGQAMASYISISCESSTELNLSIKNNETINHNEWDEGHTKASEDCCGVDCCDIDCVCSANSCSSITYLNVDVGSTQVVVFNEAVYLQKSAQPKSISTLLYRPPIYTS